MAKSKNPQQLREEGRLKYEEAKIEEDKRRIKIGRMVVNELLDKRCKRIPDLETLTNQVRAIWEG
jgi:hypothetical protein